MLEQGLARAYTAAGNRVCSSELLAAERVAREGRRGVWADAAYQVLRADSISELTRRRSTFQIVEGRITRATVGRSGVYLNFRQGVGFDWRTAFTVTLQRHDSALLGAFASDANGLEGRLVRVRGWIEQRRGPLINLSSAGLIEFLDGVDEVPNSSSRPGTHRRLPRDWRSKEPGDRPRPDAQPSLPPLVETAQ
jgi:micrococcal nuclease